MLGAIPFYDGGTYSFDEYYRRSFEQIAKAAGDHILFQRTGNPRFSDSLYTAMRMRIPEQSKEDDRLRKHWESEFLGLEAEEHQRISESIKWMERFDLHPDDLPCFVFVNQQKQKVGVLRVAHRWYESDSPWRIFLQRFCVWLARSDVMNLATANLEDAALSTQLHRLLLELTQDIDSQQVQGSQSYMALDEEAWYSPARLAVLFGVNKEALRLRLSRYQERHDAGWIENQEHGSREPKYFYRLKDVRYIIEDLLPSNKRTAK